MIYVTLSDIFHYLYFKGGCLACFFYLFLQLCSVYFFNIFIDAILGNVSAFLAGKQNQPLHPVSICIKLYNPLEFSNISVCYVNIDAWDVMMTQYHYIYDITIYGVCLGFFF